MAVKMRLQRYGTTKRPYYRLVVADSRNKRDGRYIEIIGMYDPTLEPARIEIDENRALDWLNNGAQPTDTVKNLLSKQGILAKFRQNTK